MGTKRRAPRSETRTDARVEIRKPFAECPANPCARALVFLGCNGSLQRQLAVFEGRASKWQVVDWRIGRRGMPAWAVDMLQAAIERKREHLARVGSELAPGPGMGWNKNATRGLGEWRARKNLEKRD